MGRRATVVDLQAGDRPVLEGWAQRRKTAQALAMRARIVLKGADGLSATATALEMKVCLQTVGKWRKRYAERGVDGLLDEPRPGQPRKITDADVERVITLTLESKPKAATHWSTREMAKASGINQTAISRIWRAFSLAPHCAETFKLSKDPLFIDKVRDIVGLYMNRIQTQRRSQLWQSHKPGARWRACRRSSRHNRSGKILRLTAKRQTSQPCRTSSRTL